MSKREDAASTQYSRRSQGIRKTHRKSRNGCAQCKKRHIKCDEQRPVCGDCQRLETECSLSNLDPLNDESPSEHHNHLASDSTSPNSNTINTPSSAIVQTPPTSSDQIISTHNPFIGYPQAAPPIAPQLHSHHHVPLHLNEDRPVSFPDVELLYNYLNGVIPSFISRSNEKFTDIASHDYIQLGLKTPFVLNTIMALSAIHLYSQNRHRPELYSRATALQNRALAEAHPYISNLRQEESIAMFIFSSYTAMFTFAELVLNFEPAKDPIEDMLNCFKILRGVKTVMDPFREYLYGTWLSPALKLSDFLPPTFHVEDHTPTHAAVRALADDLPGTVRPGVYEAVDQLFYFINLHMTFPEDLSGAPHPFVQTWPVVLPQSAWELLLRKEPLSLVLLAYYATLMGLRPNTWWTKGWPQQVFRGVEKALAGRHSDLLEWPREILHKYTTV